MHFRYVQLVHAMPNSWKSKIQQINSNTDMPTVKDHHIIRKSRLITVDKLHSRELYSFIIQIQNIKLHHKLILVNFFQIES